MTEERLNFLRERLAQAAEVNPSVLALREKLLSVGGVELVAPGAIDPDYRRTGSKRLADSWASATLRNGRECLS